MTGSLLRRLVSPDARLRHCLRYRHGHRFVAVVERGRFGSRTGLFGGRYGRLRGRWAELIEGRVGRLRGRWATDL